MNQALLIRLQRQIAALEKRVAELETREKVRLQVSTENCAVPAVPTEAELISAFGALATVGKGFVGVLDENDANTNVHIVWSNDTDYFYVEGTKAV